MTTPIEDTHGDPYLELLADAYRNQHAATTKILETESGSEGIRRLMGDACDRAETYAAEALRLSPPTESLACKKGCGHCCWTTVGVMAPEAIYLADQLRAALSEEELAVVQERAEDSAQKLQAMERGARLEARMPCAVLRDGTCSAYQHRPLVCRWACSPSLQSCLDHLVHKTKSYLEMEDVRYQPVQEVWRGKKAALQELGLDGSLLPLSGALAIALSQPDVAKRYLAGEPVFEEIHLD